MVTETGGSLSVLIITESDQNWQTFATWYSIYRNLPDAKVALVCHRNGQTPFVYFQWAKRLSVPSVHRNPFKHQDNIENLNVLAAVKMAQDRSYIGDTILVMKPLTMATSAFDQKFLDRLKENKLWVNEEMWFLDEQNVADLINAFYLEDKRLESTEERLYVEAKESNEPSCLTSYKKGCGRWIDSAKGCPFSSAGGLITEEMTVNENRVIELWKNMVPLYNAVV
jgi:hypothetical protein